MLTLPHVKQRTGIIILDQLQTGCRQVHPAPQEPVILMLLAPTAIYVERKVETQCNAVYRTQPTGIWGRHQSSQSIRAAVTVER
jgi:hypothetical protein